VDICEYFDINPEISTKSVYWRYLWTSSDLDHF